MRATVRRFVSPIARPKVTPDPRHAAELERRQRELEYRPTQGFLTDHRQERTCRSRFG